MEIYMNELSIEFPYELPKDIKFINYIDQGAFGKVIHAYETKKKLDLAIKVINKGGVGPTLINKMKEEISILKKLNHHNIVKFYGYSETNNQLLIQMEYIKYGTLSKWLKTKPKINEEDASIILSSVLSAVEYMHSNHICHRDIKPENIMFSEENNLSSIKIIDFGLSAQHFNYLTNKDYCGTFIYMAPEQIEKKLYHYSVDIWSIGILMFMLLNGGKHPFYQKNDKKEDFIKKIKIGKLNYINKLSFMAKHLNQKLCEVNPSWRYSAHLANKHPWITRNPNDEIPLTFNEILNRNNSEKNGSYLLMICVFLNHYKKEAIKKKEKEKDKNFYIDYFIKKKKSNIYYITKKYINKCQIMNQKQNEKYLKRRERCLEVVSTDEEDSTEKKETINRNKSKRTSLKKHIRFSEDINMFQKKTKVNERNSLYLLSIPNNRNKKEFGLNLNLKNKRNENSIDVNNYLDKMRSNSLSKFKLNEKGEFKKGISPGKNIYPFVKSTKAIAQLPHVFKSEIKNKKNIFYNINKKNNDDFSKKYNIVPLVLPFIKGKPGEKRNIII